MTDVVESFERFSETCPTMRITRLEDGGLGVEFDARQWPVFREAEDLATWLDPIVVTCLEHDQIAERIGAPIVTIERVGDELARTAPARSGEPWFAPDDGSCAGHGPDGDTA